jgi:Na+/H+-dicarboxylate symporter
LAVDPPSCILDMCSTVLNVTGDLTAATYVDRSEASNFGTNA